MNGPWNRVALLVLGVACLPVAARAQWVNPPSTRSSYACGQRSSYMDHADGKTLVETMIVKELIPLIDSRYRTIAERGGRAVHGFSMGADGCLKLVVK